MDVTASFLAGSILSWALPLALLIIVTIWWVGIVWFRGDKDSELVATSPAGRLRTACRGARS
jgi:hypothetical protein